METVETPQPTAPVEQKSTDWTKIILVAVVGFGLLAGSAYAGYYYGTQQVQPAEELTPAVSQPQPEADRPLDETPEPTTPPIAGSTQKVYKNAAIGFEIQYPEEASYLEAESYVRFYIPLSSDPQAPLPSNYFSIQKGRKIDDAPRDFQNVEMICDEFVVVDTQKISKCRPSQTLDGWRMMFTEEDNATFWVFSFVVMDSSAKNLSRLSIAVDQILSTFKFLD